MAKTYLVAQVQVHNPGGYEAYRSRTKPIIERFGGRFLVRGGTLHPLEGDPGFERLAIIEFPDLDAAEAFYQSAEYQELIPHRTANSASTLFFRGRGGMTGYAELSAGPGAVMRYQED